MENLLWATLGAALSLFFHLIYEAIRQLRTPARIFGTWDSTWQPTAAEGWNWVQEKVEISRSLGLIKLHNRDNSDGYQWRGKARLIDNTYLVGEWRSTKPGSNAEGVFALTFATEGNCLLGYFFSRDLDRGKIASGFVLGRSEQDMIQGRHKLEKTRVRFPKY